ncbi:MAG: LysR family transcriptional regulator [Gammaproteobacteria bacterium]|nr:LysR family transcriptional regulator [Gammaproteobacteria bacterium]
MLTQPSNSDIFSGMTTFFHVVSHGSFTKAAEHLEHSTSFISKEISKLEARLGVRLLNRTTRKLSLTPEGQLYFQRCKQIIEDTEALENQVSGHQVKPQGTLKISCPISFGRSHVQPILAEFLARYPEINLDIDLSDQKVDIISEGYDAVIRASASFEDSSLIRKKLLSSSIVTIASPAYLKNHGEPKHPDELSEHKVLNYKYASSDFWHFEDQNGQITAVKVKNRMITNSPELEIALCVAGEGICKMPKFNLGDLIETGKVVTLLNDYKPQHVEVFILYPSRKHMSAKVKCFIDYVMEKLHVNH